MYTYMYIICHETKSIRFIQCIYTVLRFHSNLAFQVHLAMPECIDTFLPFYDTISFYIGWYLSMKTEDSFLQRLASVSLDDMSRVWDRKSRFGARNEKTLGFLLVRS